LGSGVKKVCAIRKNVKWDYMQYEKYNTVYNYIIH
jgi:hypothetical protein